MKGGKKLHKFQSLNLKTYLFEEIFRQFISLKFYFLQRQNKVANRGKGSISGTSFKEAIRLVSSGIVNLHVYDPTG